ncbi:MAG: fructose-bisphosphate aldolase, partial [Flavobacteriales bacterium]
MALNIEELLGDNSKMLLDHTCTTINKGMLTLPNPNFVSEAFAMTNRSPQVMRNLEAIYSHGRLGGTGYVSILPVDQGIEHSAGASFAPNPIYFDPENIVKLAVEGGCNAVASTFGVLANCSRKYAHKIPFIVKLNHNEMLTYPETFSQISFG